MKEKNSTFDFGRVFYANNRFLRDKYCEEEADPTGKLREELKEEFYKIFPEYVADLENLKDWDKLVNLTVVAP